MSYDFTRLSALFVALLDWMAPVRPHFRSMVSLPFAGLALACFSIPDLCEANPEACLGQDTSPTEGQGGGGNMGDGSGGATGGNPSDDSGGTSGTGPHVFCSGADILTLPELPIACAGANYRVQLQATCVDDSQPGLRSTNWQTDVDALAEFGLTLDTDGLLSGELTEGTHTLPRITAIVDTRAQDTVSFTINSTHRCWVFVNAESPGGGSHLLAARIDEPSLPKIRIPDVLPDGARVETFDVAPDGNSLVAVVGDGISNLALRFFDLRGGLITEKEISPSLPYVAHSYSPDSRDLALVTKDPSSSEGGHLLSVARTQEQPPASPDSLPFANLLAAPLPGESPVFRYRDSLGWTGDSQILYLGESILEGLLTPQLVPRAATFPPQPGYPTEIFELAIDAGGTVPFKGFVTTESGIFSLLPALLYFDFNKTTATTHTADALSPALDATAQAIGGSLILYPPQNGLAVEAQAPGCERLLAWSADGSTLLCVDALRLVVFKREGATELQVVPMDSSLLYAPVPSLEPRRAFSRSGAWVGFVRPDGGVYVVNEEAFAAPLGEPLLPPSPQGPRDDLFFSTDERRVFLHHAQDLYIGDLTTRPIGLRRIFQSLPLATACGPALPDLPSGWCGAPRLAGPVVLSRVEANLAFIDVVGEVWLANTSSSAAPILIATKAASCQERCVQFQ